jgi:hypothetical protein
MYKTEDVLNAARAIRSHLPELLSNEAQAVEKELSALLAQADAGEDIEIDIFDLLGEHEPTRQWMETALEDKKLSGGEKTYHKPLGNSDITPPGTQKYQCPETECSHTWISHKTRQPIPECPIHHVQLVEA